MPNLTQQMAIPGLASGIDTWRAGVAPTAGSAAAEGIQGAYDRAFQEGVHSAANGLALSSRASVRPEEAQMAYDAWKIDPVTGEAAPLLKDNVLAALEALGFKPPEQPPLVAGQGGIPAHPTLQQLNPTAYGNANGNPTTGHPAHPTLQQLNPTAYSNAFGAGQPMPGAGSSPTGSNSLVNMQPGLSQLQQSALDNTQSPIPALGTNTSGATSMSAGPHTSGLSASDAYAKLFSNGALQNVYNPQTGQWEPYADANRGAGSLPPGFQNEINLGQFDPGSMHPEQAMSLIQNLNNYPPQLLQMLQKMRNAPPRPTQGKVY
jgi:hypothetical protein